jgi:hypothetical protein
VERAVKAQPIAGVPADEQKILASSGARQRRLRRRQARDRHAVG